MMNFNSNTWVRQIMDSPARQAMPIVTYPGLHLTGKTILDLVTDGEEQASCIEALAERFPSVAGVMVMDLSVEAEAFGAPVHFSQTEIPTVSGRLVNDAEGISQLKVPEVGSGRTGEYLKAAAIAVQKVTDRPVFGGTIGPYSLAGRLFDITEMMTHILLDPESSDILLSKCTEFLIKYARAYKKAGLAGIVMAEPAAGLLSPEECLEFSSKYVKKIVDAVQDDRFMIILHNCGNTVPLVPALLETGCKAFHFGNAVDMTDILPQLPSDVLAFGNIDPAGVFKMSDAAMVKSKTKALLEACKAYPNFVPSSGCDVPPGTSLSNIEAFYQAVDEFNNN